MACNPEVLKHVPLFSMLDEEESAVLASQVELKKFAPRQRIYKAGDGGGQAYVMVSGRVRVTTVDEDHQEVVVDEPAHGAFFGFASMLEQTAHQTTATALEETECLEVSQEDIATLLQRRPLAGMGMLTLAFALVITPRNAEIIASIAETHASNVFLGMSSGLLLAAIAAFGIITYWRPLRLRHERKLERDLSRELPKIP